MTNLTFFDYETVSTLDLSETNADTYLSDPTTTWLMVAYAHDDGAVKVVVNPFIHALIESGGDLDLLEDLRQTSATEPFYRPDALHVAWNARFDRLVTQHCGLGEGLQIEETIDAQCLAMACNLPGGLDDAARVLQAGSKLKSGKGLIKEAHEIWCDLHAAVHISIKDGGTWGDMGHEPRLALRLADVVNEMRRYAEIDVKVMRQVWKRCLPWDWYNWREYHANERINDRGVPIDRDFAEAAAGYRESERLLANAQMSKLTGGAIQSVSASQAINKMLYEQARPLEKKLMEDPSKKSGISLGRNTIGELLHLAKHDSMALHETHEAILEHLAYNRSTSSAKFAKMVEASHETDGVHRIHGAFRWNGAGQTGRFSSYGAQLHNYVRDGLKDREDLVYDAIMDGEGLGRITELAEVKAPSQALARMLRPTIIAPLGEVLVWGDYSQIEYVMNAWLSGAPQAEELVLEPYRGGRDLYRLQAARSLRKSQDNVTDDERQGYKVACLSLIFRGGVGAYKGMAGNYGMHPTTEEAQKIVERWRNANSWSGAFADQIWSTALNALDNPGTVYHVGRLAYVFNPKLMGGSLICQLPSTRLLVYPKARYERWVERTPHAKASDLFREGAKRVVGDDGEVYYERVHRDLRCNYRAGRTTLWPGRLVQHPTQAAAADVLRTALTRLEYSDLPMRPIGHTHDEILCTAPEEAHTQRHVDELVDFMTGAGMPGWAKDIGIRAEGVWHYQYRK